MIIILSIFRSLICLICQEVAYGRLKTKENFKLFLKSESGRGQLREVVAYKRFKSSDLTGKLLVLWKMVAEERFLQIFLTKRGSKF